ncbi:hypothetical protein J6590_071401 [Homalodisca vitripennis]|nr:hypothetical protein J6590_071401 [Homalodisca vitripennis]
MHAFNVTASFPEQCFYCLTATSLFLSSVVTQTKTSSQSTTKKCRSRSVNLYVNEPFLSVPPPPPTPQGDVDHKVEQKVWKSEKHGVNKPGASRSVNSAKNLLTSNIYTFEFVILKKNLQISVYKMPLTPPPKE